MVGKGFGQEVFLKESEIAPTIKIDLTTERSGKYARSISAVIPRELSLESSSLFLSEVRVFSAGDMASIVVEASFRVILLGTRGSTLLKNLRVDSSTI